MSDLRLFAAAVAVILLTPGPTNTLLWTSGALAGTAASLRLLTAELAGYLVGITAFRAAGDTLSHASPALGGGLKLLVAAYLLLLAWRVWRRPLLPVPAKARAVRWHDVLVTTLLNPKCAVFAFGVLPHFSGIGRALPYLALFAATVPLVGGLWIALGGWMRRSRGGGALPVLQRVAAAVLVAVAGFVAESVFAI